MCRCNIRCAANGGGCHLEKNINLIQWLPANPGLVFVSAEFKHAGVPLPDPEVAEAVGFAHDIGHPPFGHVAEHALDEEVTKRGLGDGYEGNAQTFRIVCKLALRSPSKYLGLNLSRRTLHALLKYPWFRTEDGDRNKKWSVYQTESKDFSFCKDVAADGHQSVEAQCMDIADDIAYSLSRC